MSWTITNPGKIDIVEREDGLFDIHANYTLITHEEDGHTVEFEGHPWLEGLTHDELTNTRIAGVFTIYEVQNAARD